MKPTSSIIRRFEVPAPGWVRQLWTLVAPLAFVYLVSLLAVNFSPAAAISLRYALGNLVLVVALQAFVGNSGVLSFGHLAFAAVGAWTVGLLTLSPTIKQALIPTLYPWLSDAQLAPLVTIVLAAIAGAIVAFLSGLVLMRLNGLQSGIATIALLGLTTQILTNWTKIGPPGGQAIVGVPAGMDLQGVLFLTLFVILVAWLYQRTTSVRMLRAAREDATAAPASGINITRHRLIAFIVSGGLAGIGGAMWAETNRVIQASQFDVTFTFTIISMLVIGGMFSLWGAVFGSIAISIISYVLTLGERGWNFGSMTVTLPNGSTPVVLAVLLIIVLILRPKGVTGGREAGWPFRSRASTVAPELAVAPERPVSPERTTAPE